MSAAGFGFGLLLELWLPRPKIFILDVELREMGRSKERRKERKGGRKEEGIVRRQGVGGGVKGFRKENVVW